MYDPIKYWSERTNPISRETPQWAQDYIKKHIVGNDILDYGPGEGDNFHLFKGYRVTGLDIVETYKQKALERAKELDLDYTHITGDLSMIDDYSFDTVVCSKVLLHVPYSEIGDVIRELERISGRIVVWDIYEGGPADHVFYHGFEKYLPINDVIIREKQILFWS
ncbi:MAG: class I SAM-dependent methyltransferase [Bacteroidota bacterium]